MKRRGSILAGRRRPRRRHESGWGRFARGAVEFLLILVLLFFVASWAGLLGPRQDPAPSAAGEGALGETRVVTALATETATHGQGRTALHGGGLGARPRPAPGNLQAAAVRVHLANGSGVPKLAASLRGPMWQAGFDVCGTTNADCSDYGETVVIDRSGERWKADAVCKYLLAQWGAGRVIRQARTSLESDVLVILGRDLGETWKRQSAGAR